MKGLNVQYYPRGHNVMAECLQFGGNMEFWDGFTSEQQISKYFRKCYRFAVEYIGYKSDQNMICALTVTEPHRRNLFAYYLPVVDQWQVKTMSNEKSENGNKLQLRDEDGIPVYRTRRTLSRPLLCHSEFWKQRGGQISYSLLQEKFYQDISRHYGAKRGESISLLKNTAPEQAKRYNRYENDEYDVIPPIVGFWE